MAVRQLSLWLQPEPAAAARLDAVIARLAGVHGTAVFPAHLTVLETVPRSVEDDGDALVEELEQIAQQVSPLEVRFDQTRCEPAWQRSLYLAAVPDPALRRAFDASVRVFAVPGKPVFQPHLSLQYSQLPVADKLQLAATTALHLPLSVRFDTLSLWHTAGSDAGRWRLVAARSLTTAATRRGA